MSKLHERLERAASGPARPLGFSAGSREQIPPLAIIASIAKPTKATVEAAIKAGAEFVLIPAGATPKAPPGIGSTPWGARTEALTEKAHTGLREAGCDFLFVLAGDTPLRLLNDDSIGYYGIVPADTDERRLRALERLPFEGNVIEADAGKDLTVGQAVEVAAAASRLAGPLLTRASVDWGAGEMEQLRDLGFVAVVVEIADARAAARIAGLREAILAVPSQSRRRRGRASATVPTVSDGTAAPPPDEGDDDDDFDE